MTISLIGQSQSDPDKFVSSPISVQALWEKFWLPISQYLELTWIPQWEIGLEFEAKDIPSILAEFEVVTDFINNDPSSRSYWGPAGEQFRKLFTRRMAQLRDFLKEYSDNDDYVWYIEL